MISESVQLALISTFGGLGVAYIVNIWAKKVVFKKESSDIPSNWRDRLYEAYDKLVQQLRTEIKNKDKLLKEMEEQNNKKDIYIQQLKYKLEDQVNRSRELESEVFKLKSKLIPFENS